jgi:ribosome biogenesis GTPase A
MFYKQIKTREIMALQVRQKFQIFNKELLHWHPGHMAKGTKQMQQKLKNVDCIIEVHDSRIPISGRNNNLHYSILKAKPSILVLNKKDLVPTDDRPSIVRALKNYPDMPAQPTYFTNCRDQRCTGIKKIIPTAIDIIQSSERYNRQGAKEHTIMVIGVPNCGKSSLINVLRNRHLNKRGASRVGAVAGITRSVLTRIKICEDPAIYLLDTPGVLMPNVRDVEMGMKLALCSCLQDHLVGEENIADYLLYWLNKNNNFTYVEMMGLSEPTDDITLCLLSCAKKLGKTIRLRNYHENSVQDKPNLRAAATFFLKAFRTGELGHVCLDNNFIRSNNE